MNAKGAFEVKMIPDGTQDAAEGVSIGRMALDKTFSGPLTATSVGQMIGVRTPVETSAGYVAVERVTGTLDGRPGSFVLQHSASMSGGKYSLSVAVVPDSGTDQLKGLSGQMDIQITDGKHFYDFEYALPS